jgi:hypothetical protein
LGEGDLSDQIEGDLPAGWDFGGARQPRAQQYREDAFVLVDREGELGHGVITEQSHPSSRVVVKGRQVYSFCMTVP